MIGEFLTRLRFLVWRRKPGELDEELEFHIAQSLDRNIAAGMPPDEARRRAAVEFGSMGRAREQCHEQRPGWWLGTVAQDARYALRGFRRNPLFTFTLLATLTLGIGATTAVFSVVDRILFRPLPYAHADRIVSIGMVHSLERQEFLMEPFYFDWLDNQRPFEAIAAQGTMPHTCDLVEMNPAQLNCLSFQAGLLPLLGISPALGRNFLPEEDRPNGPRVVLISYGLWLDHFNRDPDILGRSIDIDGSPARVVGVLPKDFQFPTLQSADVIFPMALDRAEEHIANGGFGYPMRCFARLKPGVSIAQARAGMEPLYQAEERWFPAELRDQIHLRIRSLRDRETADVQSIAWILLGSVFAVLLIAGANFAGLMMARGVARKREFAVRSALGATRARLARQALTESLLLSIAGAAGGLALAQGLLAVFISIAPTGVPFLLKAHPDLRIAAFAVLLSLACGACFGLLSAWQETHAGAVSVKLATSRHRALLRRGLVVGQIAASMILLSAAALLVRSFRNVEEQNLGIRTGGVIAAKIALPAFRYNTGQKQMDFYLRLESALQRLPGIQAVTTSDSVPPGGTLGFRFSDIAAEGKPPAPPGTGGAVASRKVTPDYFRALNIPILRGRGFSGQDLSSSQAMVVLSRLLAARLFPGEDAVGKRIESVHDKTWSTVIGVAENVKNGGLMDETLPEMYTLRRNLPDDWTGHAPTVMIDSVLSETAVAPWVRSRIAAIDPTVPVAIESLSRTVSTMADRPRFETALLSFFALCGLAMAIVGLYGIVSFLATQRTQEIGVRMALGARRSDILGLIALDGVRLVAVGGGLGLLLALALTGWLKSLLYEIGPRDPVSLVAVALFLAFVALAATLVPARAAMNIDPVAALRHE